MSEVIFFDGNETNTTCMIQVQQLHQGYQFPEIIVYLHEPNYSSRVKNP